MRLTSEKTPSCFGEVNTPKKYLDAKGIEYQYDCKKCPHLKECIEEYNRYVYEHWIEESYFWDEEEWIEEEHRHLCDYAEIECHNGYDCVNCEFFLNYLLPREEEASP